MSEANRINYLGRAEYRDEVDRLLALTSRKVDGNSDSHAINLMALARCEAPWVHLCREAQEAGVTPLEMANRLLLAEQALAGKRVA